MECQVEGGKVTFRVLQAMSDGEWGWWESDFESRVEAQNAINALVKMVGKHGRWLRQECFVKRFVNGVEVD